MTKKPDEMSPEEYAAWCAKPIAIDAVDGDWIKRGVWDIPATDAPSLREWLFFQGIAIEQFKTFTVYTSHVEDMPWLREL